MRVAVFGLGYVGCVSAACLANDGHSVIGVDVDSRKVEAIGEGKAPFFEDGLADLLSQAHARGKLAATTDHAHAIASSDLALVCVGTPSERSGAVNLTYLRSALETIGRSLRGRTAPYTVVLRSTVLPNVVEEELVPLLENAAGRRLDGDFGFCYNPEFLREGTAIRDFYEGPIVVVGHSNEEHGRQVAALYEAVKAPVVFTDIRTACLVKYVCNVFHALKISFANEIANLSAVSGVDGRTLMDIVCQDRKLNISAAYLRPGFAFGGSCLPKDLRAIVAEARCRYLELPVIESIMRSNSQHLQSCIQEVLDTGCRRIGILGLAFKEGTDDLRESAAVKLVETLVGKGVDVIIYEPAISPAGIYGTNLRFVEQAIPHIWKLVRADLSEVLRESEVLVTVKKLNEHELACIKEHIKPEHICIDLVGTLQGAGASSTRGRKMAQHQVAAASKA